MKFILDLFPLIAFFCAYQWGDLIFATAILMASTVLQWLILQFIYKKIDPVQRYTIIGVLSFGALTLLLNNQVYIMWKPSIIFIVLALFISLSSKIGKKHYFSARMLEKAIQLPLSTWRNLDRMWVIFFILLSLINAYFVLEYMLVNEQVLAQSLSCGINALDTDNFLCKQLKSYESLWVYFKAIGVPIASVVFVILQMLYVYRHLKGRHLT